MENKLLKAKETIEELRKEIRRLNEIHIQERKEWIEKEKFLNEELTKKSSTNELIMYFHTEWTKERAKLEAKIQLMQKEINHLNINLLYYRWDNE